MRELGCLIAGLSLAVSFIVCAWGQEQAHLSQGSGLAAKYPGDVGIEDDAAVLFAENFETGTIIDLAKRWDNVSNKNDKVISFATDAPPESAIVIGTSYIGPIQKR